MSIDMDVFDQLPPEMRAALRDASYHWYASTAVSLYAVGWSTEQIIAKLHVMEIEKHREDAATGLILGGQK